jgi:uncharacterized protein YhaN
MRIREISIDGFGVWSGLRLTGLDEPINVLYGPNEAGKTTLMQFLRAMLYGFSPDRRQRYLPPVNGGHPGGELTVTGADGTFTVRRHAAPDESAAGRLECVAGGEVIRDDRLLARLSGNVDEAVYRNVFAIGLREIQELGALTDTEAAQWLYKLATGADRVSLVDVLAELAKARQRILAADDAPSTIPQLLADRDKLRREIVEKSAVRQYVDLGRKRRELLAQIDDWEQEAQTGERSARLVEAAAAIHEKWHARQAVEKDLAAARSVPHIEPQTLADFDNLAERIARGKRRKKALARRMAKNHAEMESLGLNEAVWRRAATIEAILAEEQWITALDAERVALADKVTALEARRVELCTRLGFDPAATAAEPGEGMSKAWRQLKPLAGGLRAAREQLTKLSEEAEVGQQGAQAAAEQLVAALKARGAESLTPLLERAGQLVSQLRRRVQLEDRLAELSRRKSELDERSRELLANALLPGWAVIALGAVFVLGVVAALAGLFLPASLVGSGRWVIATVGFVAAAGAGAAKFLLEKAFEQRSKTCLAQLQTLTGQIEEATHERNALDEQLPRGGGPLLARLQAAEKEQAAVEALLPLESKRQAAAQEGETAEKRREDAHQEYIQLRHRWHQALVAAGLSPKTPPGRAGQLTHIRKNLARFDARLADERGQLARRQSVVAAFANRLAQLQAELDMRPEHDAVAPAARETALPVVRIAEQTPTGGLSDKLRALREQLREQTALAARRRSLVQAGRKLVARRRKAGRRTRLIERKLAALLAREGAADAGELRRRADESARRDQLTATRDAQGAEIRGLVGPQLDEAEIATLVSTHSRQELDQRWLDVSARARQLREQVKDAHEQLGRWQQESQMLADDRAGSQLRLRLVTIEQQLRDAQARWRVLAAAEWFLAGVRKRYERERQPETLREASGYLDRLTEGRYRRVWTPLDQDVLRVDDADGHSLRIEILSRGTREQLFLSLRLALVSWYARRGIELPLVLDDVLVNFDAQRARAAAVLLREFAARGHQLLVFTCHEHMYELFRSLGVSSRELPANPRLAALAGTVVTTRPAATEVIEPPPPQPTNGHTLARDETVESPPRVARRQPVAKDRAHVKFDCTHGPRGPFASALWHERVTYELSGDADSEESLDHDDEWTDVDGNN